MRSSGCFVSLLGVLVLAFLASCPSMGAAPDLQGAIPYLQAAERTLADMEAFSAAHPETEGDVPSIAKAREALEAVQGLIAAGGDLSTLEEKLAALDAATAPLLASPNPRIGQLAILLRGSIGTFLIVSQGQQPPESP